MNIYGVINGQAELVQSTSLCVWELKRYEEDGSLKSYLGFECTTQELIPENGEVIADFRSWLNKYAPTEDI